MTSPVANAEHDAQELLYSMGPTTLPVDPFDIARGLGIHVNREPLPADESGKILIPPQGQVVITINRNDHEHRQRFTCAHEIGHYYYVRVKSLSIGFTETLIDYRSTLAGLGIDNKEIYANQFAAALLMPARLVQEKILWQGKTAGQLAVEFGTSAQAMEIRLRNLRLTTP